MTTEERVNGLPQQNLFGQAGPLLNGVQTVALLASEPTRLLHVAFRLRTHLPSKKAHEAYACEVSLPEKASRPHPPLEEGC
jgi:hypothetical protein